MTTDEFISKAQDGGWLADVGAGEPTYAGRHELMRALLDPEAWKAVGKVEGWDKPITAEDRKLGLTLRRGYLIRMHMMIDALADGKTIEEFLETL